MTGRHAGPSRQSDTQLLDQARACAEEIRMLLAHATITDRHKMLNLLGRAASILDMISEAGS